MELKYYDWQRVLTHLISEQYFDEGSCYTSNVAKALDITYSHTVNLVNHLNKIGLVETKLDGRKKFLTLTDKGKVCALSLSKSMEVLHNGK